MTCPFCSGEGYRVEMAHACGGDEKVCQSTCPIQEQVQCESCNGSGQYGMEETT